MQTPVDFATLYDEHPEYAARRQDGSYEQAQIELEVRLFKLPNLLALIPEPQTLFSVLEIGCATGELIAAMPVCDGGRRVGMDISAANIAVARERHPRVEFRAGDFREMSGERFDAVILSDVLEHVPDDLPFLRDASRLGSVVLLNLPLEDNWLNRKRRYGPEDVSGHLRRYSLEDGQALISAAGLQVIAQSRVWVHETQTEGARRALRRGQLGAAFSGNPIERAARQCIFELARAVRPFGRRLFASNLFVAAGRATP